MGHSVKKGKFMVKSSLFKQAPSYFLTKSTERDKPSSSCGYSSSFILNFIQFLFFILGAIVPYDIPVF